MIKFTFLRLEGSPVYSSNPYYDIFHRGNIEPKELLSDLSQVDAVREAVAILDEFLAQAQDAGVLVVI